MSQIVMKTTWDLWWIMWISAKFVQKFCQWIHHKDWPSNFTKVLDHSHIITWPQADRWWSSLPLELKLPLWPLLRSLERRWVSALAHHGQAKPHVDSMYGCVLKMVRPKWSKLGCVFRNGYPMLPVKFVVQNLSFPLCDCHFVYIIYIYIISIIFGKPKLAIVACISH